MIDRVTPTKGEIQLETRFSLNSDSVEVEPSNSRRKLDNRTSWSKRLVPVLVGLCAAGVLSASGGVPASAATLGTATTRGFDCSNSVATGRQVRAIPPTMTSVSGGLEEVEWSPDLYRYNPATRTWDLYATWHYSDGVRFWYYAVANANGPQYNAQLYGTWFMRTEDHQALLTSNVLSSAFSNLPSGYYAVLDRYRWANGTTASLWSPLRSGGSYCQL